MQDNPYFEQVAERRDPQREVRSTARFLAVIVAIVLCVAILFTQIFLGVQVIGSSMEPTLYEGDYLFVDTTASIHRGDIVVVEADMQDNIHDETVYEWIVKRVIGLPGDTLYAQNGILYRREDGEAEFSVVEEPYLDEADGWRGNIPQITVPDGQVYLLGDHRSVSLDSREHGPQPLAQVVGVVSDWSLAMKEFLSATFGLFARKS